jgi:hypothetical protein
MNRIAFSLALALAVIVCSYGSAPHLARAAAPLARDMASPFASSFPEEVCNDAESDGWQYVNEVPVGWSEWAVRPLDSSAAGEERDLYLVIITLGPGKCIPFSSPSNQKDGGVLLILQEGEITFTWQPHPDAPGAAVEMGGLNGAEDNPPSAIAPGEEHTLNQRGQWISQDDLIYFTYENRGAFNAVIWKVVWAPPPVAQGCAGDCK